MPVNENVWKEDNLIKVLKENGVVVMPTDTIYGVVGRAENEKVVNRVYAIRQRSPQKPCIILIGDIGELQKFSVALSEKQKIELSKYWSFDFAQDYQSFKPGPVSVVLDCLNNSLEYLHRGTQTLAFRIPGPQALRNLLLKTGPLIAPSANKENYPPNYNIASAKKHFGDLVDLYVDVGEERGKASRLIRLHHDGSVDILRE